MKIKFCKEKCIGESKVIDEKLKNIYGAGVYDKERIKIQRENKQKYMMVLLMIGLLILATIFSSGAGDMFIKNNKGNVAAISKSDDIGSVPIKISGVWDGEEFTKDVIIEMPKPGDNKNKDDAMSGDQEGMEKELKNLELENMITELIENLRSNFKGEKILLPDKLSDGTGITWQEEKKNHIIPILILGILLLYGIYQKRFDGIKKHEQEANESVMRDLPGFLNKLALLMNAGLVFGSAYERIIDEKIKIGWSGDSYFYNQLIMINENVNERNCSIQKELADFATRSQNKEFIRAVGIINDNISKGIMLTDKLRGESEALWFAQKKYIEEKSKLSETKLVGPLFIILGILIVITMVPAMMGM